METGNLLHYLSTIFIDLSTYEYLELFTNVGS